MKNSAVREMVYEQFNLDRSINIQVECLDCINNVYSFEVFWVDEDNIHYQINMEISELQFKKRDLNTMKKLE